MVLRDREFVIRGRKLAALESAGKGLPVMALHGWLDNAATFFPLAEYLPECHLLALDLPGHGHSDHLSPDADYHLVDNLRWLAAVADAMGWQRFALLGHSMGAAVATLAAAAMPERVRALSLLDGVGPVAYSEARQLDRLQALLDAEPTVAARAFPDIATAVRVRRRFGRYTLSSEAAELLVARNLEHRKDGYYWRYDQRLRLPSSFYYSESQVQALLRAIACPTQLIRAQNGALAGWYGLAERNRALQQLQHVVLPGGHYLHMEAPQQVAECVVTFLSEQERMGGGE